MKKTLILIITILLTLGLAACAILDRYSGDNRAKGSTPDPGTSKSVKNSTPNRGQTQITLFFADDQAMYVLPEDRMASAEGKGPIRLAIEELIKGPQAVYLRPTLPPQTRLLGADISGVTAVVNFSKEFQTNHPGGSAGETMTIQSIVNTLTTINGVERVQFMVEGRRIESLAGHYDLTAPMEREILTGPININLARAEDLQRQADNGQSSWLLQPLTAAPREALIAGFLPGDVFVLLKSDPQAAPDEVAVKVTHKNLYYVKKIIQRVKDGSGGIWTIGEVNYIGN